MYNIEQCHPAVIATNSPFYSRRPRALSPDCRTRTMPTSSKPPRAIAVGQALDAAAALRPLRERMAASSARLDTIRALLPAPLRRKVMAGPIDEEQWCLLVPHPAAAAKIRQLLPALRAALEANGHPRRDIRIRVIQDPVAR